MEIRGLCPPAPACSLLLKMHVGWEESCCLWLPRWLSGKKPVSSVGDLALISDWEDPPEEEMATHSSILAWTTPWTEEPDGIQSTTAALCAGGLGWVLPTWRYSHVALVVKRPPARAGDVGALGSAPGGEDPGGGNSCPLQCSGLENPMDRGAWWAVVCRVAELAGLKRPT